MWRPVTLFCLLVAHMTWEPGMGRPLTLSDSLLIASLPPLCGFIRLLAATRNEDKLHRLLISLMTALIFCTTVHYHNIGMLWYTVPLLMSLSGCTSCGLCGLFFAAGLVYSAVFFSCLGVLILYLCVDGNFKPQICTLLCAFSCGYILTAYQ